MQTIFAYTPLESDFQYLFCAAAISPFVLCVSCCWYSKEEGMAEQAPNPYGHGYGFYGTFLNFRAIIAFENQL